MNKFLLSLIVFFLLTSQVWADTYVDTLSPAEDATGENGTEWAAQSGTDRYAMIDEDPAGQPNDVDYIYEETTGDYQGWFVDSIARSTTIDSLRYYVRVKKSGASSDVAFGGMLWNWEVSSWGKCSSEWDTLTELTTSYVLYSHGYGSTDPCTGEDWVWANIMKGQTSYNWAVQALDVGMLCRAWVSLSYIVVYSHTVEEEEKAIVKIYKNGVTTKIYENGEIVKIYEP